jgi:hypothetical protein
MFKKKTLSSLPPEEAGTFSEFDKKEKPPARKSMFSKGGDGAQSQEITFEMSDAQRAMLRLSNAPPREKTEEEKRIEQEE